MLFFRFRRFPGVRPCVIGVHESLGFGRIRRVLQVLDTRVYRHPDGRNASRLHTEQSDFGASLAVKL